MNVLLLTSREGDTFWSQQRMPRVLDVSCFYTDSIIVWHSANAALISGLISEIHIPLLGFLCNNSFLLQLLQQ